MVVDLNRHWLRKARCRNQGSDLFFPDHTPIAQAPSSKSARKQPAPSSAVRKQWEEAKEVCIECPVMVQCGRDFLGEIEGVWGGLDPLERVALRDERTAMVYSLPPGPQRRQWTSLAYRLANSPRCGVKEAERILGLAPGTVSVLVKEFGDELKTQAARAADGGKVVDLPLPDVEWPASPPATGDGWVHRRGTVVHAYYLGETEDGAWLYMKGPISGKEDSLSWFRARDVQLTSNVGRTVKHRVGETSRIYGTTISPKYGAATKAG